MRSGTLGLFYFCKIIELIFLTVWTVLLLGSAMWLIRNIAATNEPTDTEKTLIYLTPVCMLFALMNLFYNNLLINLRFKCKISSLTVGYCIFDVVNFLFCYCILRMPCRDRCFTVPTLIKWGCKAALFGYTIYLVKQRNEDLALTDEQDPLIQRQSDANYLDTYLLVYILQHVVFLLARIPIFILYSLLTCCCNKGDVYPQEPDENGRMVDPTFKDRIISFDFIEYELHALNNFENHVAGLNELEYNRNLSVMINHQRPIMEDQMGFN